MSDLRRALGKLRRLSWRERRLLAEAMSLLPAVHLVQQTLPFRRWRQLLERAAPAPGPAPGQPSVETIAWSVEVARHWLPGRYQCLPAAYAAHLLLHRYGYASDIHVGVSRDPAGKVEAHAWVDCEGRTVIGSVQDLDRFVPFPPLRAVKR